MSNPLFTQKHYEYLITQLRARGPTPECVVDLLCDIFTADNPKFKSEMFRVSLAGAFSPGPGPATHRGV